VSDESVPHHDQLPLPDYDHLPLGSIGPRIGALDADGVAALLAYEKAHGDRLPVVTVLEQRLETLRSGAAQPTGGDPTAETPELQHAPPAGSPVSPQTEGPSVNPPSHGDPTNPAQPRG
jgi:hypothetical protein